MYVEINGPSLATVCDADNLRELLVKTHGVDENQVGAALAASGLGSVEDEHAWLPVEALKSAGEGLGPEWDEGFEGMLAYAASRGWLSADGRALRAHLERTY